MTVLDEALAVVGDRAKLVGLWLATHPAIPSLGPTAGPFLLEIAKQAAAALASEPDETIKHDVASFVGALVFVSHCEMVHGCAIVSMVEQLLASQERKEEPDAS